MLTTTVEFNVESPVASVESRASTALDVLVARWRKDPAVSSVTVDWKALPRTDDSLVGCAEVRVSLQADTHLALREAYERLTRHVTRAGALRLSGRGCVLTELFE